ncbi:MAG: nicotinate-nicotinamide nucleotide adenylyltransferase, partial [Candidatus Zixiibacteriota bacterium]
IDTLKAVKIKYPGIDFFFIIGADNISRIKNWHKPDEIINEVKIIAGSRPPVGSQPSFELINVSDDITGKIEFIETPLVNISSSNIRQLFISGSEREILNEFVDDSVREFIIKNKLYQ